MKPQTETQLVRACLDFLSLKKIFAWRVNSGGVRGEYKGKKRFVRFNTAKGHSDIAGVLPNGRALFVECKVGKNDLTVAQWDFMWRVRKSHALFVVVRSLDDLSCAIESIHSESSVNVPESEIPF